MTASFFFFFFLFSHRFPSCFLVPRGAFAGGAVCGARLMGVNAGGVRRFRANPND